MAEQLEPGNFIVRDLSLDDATGSEAHFVRSPERHAAALQEFFDRTGSDYARFNYLGEWHSHPNFDVNPSPVDIVSMNDLVTGERDIQFAALLIVRLRYLLWLELTASAFVRGRPAVVAHVQ